MHLFISLPQQDRIICLMGPVNDYVSSIVVAQLLFLQSESSKKPIHMYINSPGGSVTAGLAIYDTMQYVLPPISTWCVGQACSMGSLLLAAGTQVKTLSSFIETNELDILGDSTFHRDRFSDSIFGWVIDDLTELGRHAQLHLFRHVTVISPIDIKLIGFCLS